MLDQQSTHRLIFFIINMNLIIRHKGPFVNYGHNFANESKSNSKPFKFFISGYNLLNTIATNLSPYKNDFPYGSIFETLFICHVRVYCVMHKSSPQVK